MTFRRGRSSGQSRAGRGPSDRSVSRYGVFHIASGKIDVEKVGERANNYEDFMTDLLQKDGEKDDCRFASKSVNIFSRLLLIFLLQFSTTSTSSPPREPRPRSVRREI